MRSLPFPAAGLALLVVLLAPFARAAAQGGADDGAEAPLQGERFVHARLLAEEAGFRAGSTTTLAVALALQDGWHLYWKGQNASGLPIALQARVPEGWTTGPLQWPAPERHVWAGDFVDHVYRHEVALLLPLHVPADATPGTDATIAVRLDYLVCEEACLPGSADLALTLPVLEAAAERRPGEGAALVTAARARLPGPAPEGLTARWDGGLLRLRLPGAAALAFLPEEGSLPLADLARTGEARGDELLLRPDADLPGGERVVGVLLVTGAGGAASSHALDLPGPPPGEG